MNIKQFFRRYAAAKRLGLGFSGMARFTMPSAFTFGTEKILVHAPEEKGLAFDFCELILDDDYGLKRIDADLETIVDIGGLFSLWANLNFPNAKIHCYEPNPRLQVYLSRNLRGKVTVYSEGVGREDGRAAMLDNAESRLGRVGQGNELQITAIRTVLNRAGGKVDLLKMDCEGAEWDILQDAESMRKVREIRMEYHEVGGHVFADLEKLLEEQGFTRTYLKANNGFGIVHYKNNGPWDHQANPPVLTPQLP
jgi:FkbM family methyltransferase